MTVPHQPRNPRVVYPDGQTVPIRQVWYGNQINGTHVWVAEDPQFVPWRPGVHVEYDHIESDEWHLVVVGFDVEGEQQ